MFLYSTVSTLKPIVGIVVTTSPICSRYNIVVFPAVLMLSLKLPPNMNPSMASKRTGIQAEHEYPDLALFREKAREARKDGGEGDAHDLVVRLTNAYSLYALMKRQQSRGRCSRTAQDAGYAL